MSRENVILENVRIVFRNFAGREGKYNREGDRNFTVILDEETGQKLLEQGWNVKRLRPREDDEEGDLSLPVSVSFKIRAPRMVMLTSRNRTELDEEMCELLDQAVIKNVDMILTPYEWSMNGKTGVKAYLKTIYVTIEEDPLDVKYSRLEGEAELMNVDEGELR